MTTFSANGNCVMMAARTMPIEAPMEYPMQKHLQGDQQVLPVERPEVLPEGAADLARRREGVGRDIEDPHDDLETANHADRRPE